MDIIDKALSNMKREQAPASLRARILDIPEQQRKPVFSLKLLRLAVPALAIIALLVSGIYYQYFGVRNIAAAFELSVDGSDAAGISPESVFVLKSSKDITAAQVKKVVRITPEVDFDVESDGKNRFLIKPRQKLSGETVYQVSIAEGAAERDYSWAYQVRAPFGLLTTFPRNQAVNVPVNTSIEATFTREGLEKPEQYFQITPSTAGKFEVRGDTVVFVPGKPLQERTVYTVTFRQGMTAKGSAEAMPQDVSFSFETGQTVYQPYPEFGFSQDFVQFPADRTAALQVYRYNTDLKDSEARLYAFDRKEDFVQGYYGSRKWDWGWTSYYRQSGDVYDTSKLRQLSTFKPSILTFEYQNFFELPDRLQPGYYLLEMKSGDLRRQAWILVNDISHYYSLTDENGFAWVYDFGTKKPIAGTTVAFYDNEGRRHELGKTNGDGLAEFGVPEGLRSDAPNSANYGRPKVLEIEQPGKPATFMLVSAGWWYASYFNPAQDYWKYLSTDRYTYRLTDTIRFWGVVKGKSRDIREQNVTVQLRSPEYAWDMRAAGSQQRPIAETQASITPFDTISGSLDFKGVSPGTYEVVVLMNDQVVSRSSVEIFAYVKPLYHISVKPSKDAVFAGEAVDFDVKAEFYDGTPVGSLQLRYTGYYDREISGTVNLNQKGEGRVTLTPQYNKTIPYYPFNLNLNFYPVLAEEGEITSESSSSVLVFGPRVYLQATQKYNDNNNFTITAKANTITLDQMPTNRDTHQPYPEYIGAAKSGVQLSAEVEKTQYLQIEDGTVYDPINKIAATKYRYEERKTIVQRLSGTTNASGEWVFDLKLPKDERAYYQVRINGEDGSGRPISATVWPYYYRDYGNLYYEGASGTQNRVVLSLGYKGGQREYDKRFSVGDQVELTAEALEGADLLSGTTLFYRYGHTGIGKLELVKGNTFSEQFQETYKPAVSYRAVVFGPYGFVESNSLMAAFKQEDAKLDISIRPDKQAYRPGETAKLEVEVKDRQGKTRDGEVNLSVVDEAVFDIVPYYWQQEILNSLYEIDYTDPRSGASDFTPEALQQNGGAEGGGCFLPDTPILLPGGKTAAIKDIKVGDVVLTRAGEGSKQLVSAIVQGISRHQVDEYLIINGQLKVTGEHPLFVNGKWVPAGLVRAGDRLTGTDGEEVAVASIEKVRAPETQVHNINVGKYHTYFAEGFFVHNAEKGGGYRSEFLDTAHFESKRLEGGKAEFTVKLPDNITSWRATVSAFGRDGIYAGQEHKLLPASLPFFTDSVISETYLTGDQPSVVVRAFGTSMNPGQDATYTLDVDALNYHESKTARSDRAEFALPALPVGSYEMKIKAKQGNNEDGLIRKFKVVDSYFTVKESRTTQLSQGLRGLPGNPEGYTDVTFTDTGKARFFQDLLWNQYQGGKRADQAVVSALARQLLKDSFGVEGETQKPDLGAYHVPGGGIALFTYGDSDLALSAKLADVAPDAVYRPQLIQYFRTAIRGDKADIHQIARGLYGLASLGQPVLAKMQFIKDEPSLTLEDRMYLALGMARLGDREGALQYYREHIRPELRFEGNQAWLSGEQDQTRRAKLTTLAGAVAAGIGQSQDALQVWEYAREHYPSEDLDILERFMIIRAEIARLSQQEASLTFEVGGKRETVKLEKGASRTLRFSKDELSQISFSDISGQPAAVSVLETFQRPEQLATNSELDVRRSYWVNGKQVSSFREGETVVVRLEYQIQKQAIDGGYQVVDFLPSGLKPVANLWNRGLPTDYRQCSQRGFPLAVEGNKVYFSAYHSRDSRGECSTYRVEYYARAAAKGSFKASPPLIQSLKNYNSLNVGQTQNVTVQ